MVMVLETVCSPKAAGESRMTLDDLRLSHEYELFAAAGEVRLTYIGRGKVRKVIE